MAPPAPRELPDLSSYWRSKTDAWTGPPCHVRHDCAHAHAIKKHAPTCSARCARGSPSRGATAQTVMRFVPPAAASASDVSALAHCQAVVCAAARQPRGCSARPRARTRGHLVNSMMVLIRLAVVAVHLDEERAQLAALELNLPPPTGTHARAGEGAWRAAPGLPSARRAVAARARRVRAALLAPGHRGSGARARLARCTGASRGGSRSRARLRARCRRARSQGSR